MTLREQIETRIVSAQCGFKEVKGSGGLPDFQQQRVVAPGCYIFRARSQAGANERLNAVCQRVEEDIAVVVVTRHVGERGDSDGSDANAALCEAVSAALLGWEPDGYEPIIYRGGQLVSLRNGFFIWQELYRTARFIRS